MVPYQVMWRLSSLRGGSGTPTLRFDMGECRGRTRLAETSIRGAPISSGVAVEFNWMNEEASNLKIARDWLQEPTPYVNDHMPMRMFI